MQDCVTVTKAIIAGSIADLFLRSCVMRSYCWYELVVLSDVDRKYSNIGSLAEVLSIARFTRRGKQYPSSQDASLPTLPYGAINSSVHEIRHIDS
jgi:hypothetical protein